MSLVRNLFLLLIFGLTLNVYSQDRQQSGATVPKIVSSGVVNGKALSLPKPDYPKAALDSGVSGAVRVQVLIDEQGNVTSAKAIEGAELLQQVSAAAALQAKFAPALLEGRPVKVSGIIEYNFTPPNYEEQCKYILLGLLLNFPDFIDAADDEDFINGTTGDEMAADLPNFAAELRQLNSLRTVDKNKRAAFLAEIASKIEPKLNTDEMWQYKVGKGLTDILKEGYKQSLDENYQVKESVLRSALLSFRELSKNAPNGFPPAVISKLAALGALAEKTSLTSPEDLRLILSQSMAMIETISPDSK